MNTYVNHLQQNEALQLYQKAGVLYVGLFGSSARGEDKESSDVDLLVDFDETKSLFQLADVQFGLEKILGKKVDLVLKNRIKKVLAPYINQDLLQVYAKN